MPVWLLNIEIFISHILTSEYILEYIILRFCNMYISRASYGYKLTTYLRVCAKLSELHFDVSLFSNCGEKVL